MTKPADVMKADPAARVQVAIITLAVVALVIAAAVAGQKLLPAWTSQLEQGAMDRMAREEPERLVRLARWLFYGAFGVGALMAIVPGTLYVRMSRRVLGSGQFPAPGATVLRDTPIERGRLARRRGRITGLIGWALITVGVGLFGFGHVTFKQLLPDERIERLMECKGRWGPDQPCLLEGGGSDQTPSPVPGNGRGGSGGRGASPEEMQESGPRRGPGEDPTEEPSDGPATSPVGPAVQLKVALYLQVANPPPPGRPGAARLASRNRGATGG